jgi:ABC-type transport system involved in multi-copper enzyme maturation permease subunit
LLWNIRKKKFIGIIIVVFAIATLVLLIPVIGSATTGVPITKNNDYAITFGGNAFVFLLLAIGTAMNSFSSEFESGTIVPLVSKPVSRTMIFLGKLFVAFVLLLISYVILYGYITLASLAVYGPQIDLQYMPLIVVGSLLSTLIWEGALFAVGCISKNTIVTIIVAIGLFLALLIAGPIITVYSGPSQALNYLPGTGATGTLTVGQNVTSVDAGTDNMGTNLVNYALYPSANVSFYKTNLTAITANETVLPNAGLLYTESTGSIAATSAAVGCAYIAGFLIVAWIAFKRSQILE